MTPLVVERMIPWMESGVESDVAGGIVASAPSGDAPFDYPRLARAVESLLATHERLRDENTALRTELAARDERVGDLEAALRDQQQRRADAIARIDALVAQLDELDGRLERAEEASPVGASAGATP